MNKRASRRTILPSLLDRLIDREPANRNEAAWARSQTPQEMRESVRRDLEWLLNSRRTPNEPSPTARELWRSAYCYGVPDITGTSVSSSEDQQRLARALETVIAAFEPRLAHPVVSLAPGEEGKRVLRFQIEALLRSEPAPARVYFDAALELSSGRYEIGGGPDAR